MKKLILVLLAIVFLVGTAHAWTLSWDAVSGVDNLKILYKTYPVGYSYPDNPAPANIIQDTAGMTEVMLAGDAIEYELPDSLSENQRYVFFIQAIDQGSVAAESDFLCWTKPAGTNVIELPLDAGGDIQINIYQAPR